MELDQKIFRAAWNLARGVRRRLLDRIAPRGPALTPADCARYTVLARVLAGVPRLEVRTGGAAPGGLRAERIEVPEWMPLLPDADERAQFYLFRTALHALQRTGASADAALSELPALRRLYDLLRARLGAGRGYQALTAEVLEVLLVGTAPERPVERPGVTVPAADGGSPTGVDQVSTELEAKLSADPVLLEVDRKKIEEYTLGHSFEKIDTIEEFSGNWRDLDGADELDAHAEALEELNLQHTVRSDDPTHSVYRADGGGGGAPEVADQAVATEARRVLAYDEWNYAKRAYRPEYCHVHEFLFRDTLPAYAAQVLRTHRATRTRLARRMQRLKTELRVRRRLNSGDEPDLDALVERFADLKAGVPPQENVYAARRRAERDLALLILLDRSLSTDSYVAGRRILDVEKESLILFGDTLAEAGDRFAVHAFASRTRHRCEYYILKSFAESWQAGRDRVGALSPLGYTRIGPALRHATHWLSREHARRRWLILLSDGRPNDYDRYEGRYGMEDVRQAVREAGRAGVQLYALAVDTRRHAVLPAMLGGAAHRILPRPGMLPEALAEFYERLRSAR